MPILEAVSAREMGISPKIVLLVLLGQHKPARSDLTLGCSLNCPSDCGQYLSAAIQDTLI
jgi:hypothetical protein